MHIFTLDLVFIELDNFLPLLNKIYHDETKNQHRYSKPFIDNHSI
jgi:hypothetical protein